jgi:hypothetical protein
VYGSDSTSAKETYHARDDEKSDAGRRVVLGRHESKNDQRLSQVPHNHYSQDGDHPLLDLLCAHGVWPGSGTWSSGCHEVLAGLWRGALPGLVDGRCG